MTELEELAVAFDESLANLLPMPELLDSARRDSELEAKIREQIYGPVSYTHLTLPTILRV